MNFIDIIIVLLVAVTVLRGVEVGLVRQAASLIGLVGGIYIGSAVAARLPVGALEQSIVVIVTIIIAMVASELGGLKLKQWLDKTKIIHADKALGAAMGVVTCLALVWLGSALVSAIPAPEIQKGIRDSRIIAWLDRELPPATDVLSRLEQSFAQTGLPGLFEGTEPHLNPQDARIPDVALFSSVLAAHKASVVELEGRSCQGIGVGSGFVIDENLVMTNAHVVAGMLRPYIRDDNGRHLAKVVAFDKDLDIAVLEATNLAGDPLALHAERVEEGSIGVATGYPHGGDFTASPARIVDDFTAVGQDIYGESRVEREVYAMRADIQPGNSGGPVLSRNGEVVGVVFARSTEYQSVGYAVTMGEAIRVLTQAQTNPSAGSSARCIAS